MSEKGKGPNLKDIRRVTKNKDGKKSGKFDITQDYTELLSAIMTKAAECKRVDQLDLEMASALVIGKNGNHETLSTVAGYIIDRLSDDAREIIKTAIAEKKIAGKLDDAGKAALVICLNAGQREPREDAIMYLMDATAGIISNLLRQHAVEINDQDDIKQTLAIKIMESTKYYVPMGNELSTFLMPYLKSGISEGQRQIKGKSGQTKHYYNVLIDAKKAEALLESEGNYSPTEKEISTCLETRFGKKISATTIKRAKEFATPAISYDKYVEFNQLEDMSFVNPEHQIVRRESVEALYDNLHNLNSIEVGVMLAYLSLLDESSTVVDPHSPKTAERYNLMHPDKKPLTASAAAKFYDSAVESMRRLTETKTKTKKVKKTVHYQETVFSTVYHKQEDDDIREAMAFSNLFDNDNTLFLDED